MNYQIDRELCVDCEACEGACPVGAIALQPYRHIDTSACVECGACADGCPVEAIKESMSGQINALKTKSTLQHCFQETSDCGGADTLSAKLIKGEGDQELFEFSVVVDGDGGYNTRMTVYANVGMNEFYCYLGDHAFGQFIEALDENRIHGLDKDIERAWPAFHSAWKAANAYRTFLTLQEENPDAASKLEGIEKVWELQPRMILHRGFPTSETESWCTGITISDPIPPDPSELFSRVLKTTMPLVEFTVQMISELNNNELGSQYRAMGYAKAMFSGMIRGFRIGNVFDSILSFIS